MGLLDLSKEDEKRAINAGLLRAGLLMMQPVRGGRGKFAPQFSQGALGGLDAYGEARGSLQKQRTEERKLEEQMQAERRRREAAADLANIYGGQDQSQPSPPQFNQPSPVLPYTDMEKSGPARQQYGLLNPRGRIPNAADMENDKHEQMALNGMSPEERGQFIDVQDEYRNMAEMPNQTGQVPPIAQNFPLNDLPQEKPYPALSFVDGEIPELPQEEVVGMRQRQTEPIPRMPQFELRDSPTPGINPSAAPVRIGNNNVDWAKRYRVAQIAMENGVPGAKEALAALLEERKPKFSNVAAGSSVFNENTGKVEYTAPDAAYSLSPGEIRMRGDEQIAVAPERKPTQTELAKLMQEREELARINPSHPQLVTYDRVIDDYKQGGGVTVNTGNLGKPPTGFRWKEDGSGDLEAIKGGPQDELGEAQKSQVIGVQNTRLAIKEYRDILPTLSNWDLLSPDRRSDIGLKYNNMLLQAKEAYRLGVINGPDYEILQKIVTNPLSITGAITSSAALDRQAQELDRIMSGIEGASGNRRPQDKPINDLATSRKPPPPSGIINGYDISSTISEANKAIRNGASPDAVRKKLEKYGFSKSIISEYLDAR